MEAHVTSVVPDDGVRLHGCVVHQNLCFINGVGGGKSLLVADFVELDKHGGVNGERDVEKGAGNALHARDAAFLKFRYVRGVGRALQLGPISRCDQFVGKLLRVRGYRLLEALQGFADGVGQGDVDVVFRVVSINGESAVLAARWVEGDGVILPEWIEEVGGFGGGK